MKKSIESRFEFIVFRNRNGIYGCFRKKDVSMYTNRKNNF